MVQDFQKKQIVGKAVDAAKKGMPVQPAAPIKRPIVSPTPVSGFKPGKPAPTQPGGPKTMPGLRLGQQPFKPGTRSYSPTAPGANLIEQKKASLRTAVAAKQDPAVRSKVSNQYGVSPIANPASIAKYTGIRKGLGNKMFGIEKPGAFNK